MRRWAIAAALLWASAAPAAAGTPFTCSGYLHEALDGFPTHVDWGAALPGLDPATRVEATFAGDGFVEDHRQRLGADHAVLFTNGVITFDTFDWTISAGGEEIASGSVEVGPEEEPGCTIAALRAEARRALRELSPSPSPSPSPPRASPPPPEEGAGPWPWLIALGGLLVAGGGVLLRRGTGEPAPAPVRGDEGLAVALGADPAGRLEKPIEEGETVELTATVRNDGAEPVPGVRLRILQDGDEDHPLLDHSWKRPLAPAATVSASAKTKAPRGRPLGPGLTTISLQATADGGGGRRAASEEAILHVAHPVLIASLETEPAGRVAEGTEVLFTVKVGNVGRGTAKDLEGTLEVSCEGRGSRDTWERTFEIEELKPGKAHEEGFRISPSALGESRTARLTGRARVESGEEKAESGEVKAGVTPA